MFQPSVLVSGALAILSTATTPTAATDAAPTCEAGAAADGSPIRRLTVTEFDNTILDLLGDDGGYAKNFPEEGGSGFDNNAHLAVASRLHAQKYMVAAEKIATRAAADPRRLLACDAGVAGEDACFAAWLPRFGLRAWRRPLDKQEIAAFTTLERKERARGDFASGVRMVLQAMLQSPHFLYRVEVGAPDPTRPGVFKLTGFELASRLSYLLWGTTPDEQLLRAAEDGKIETAAQVAAQARRMLMGDAGGAALAPDPRAKQTVRRFYDQWLGMRQFKDVGKDRGTFPAWRRVKQDLRAEYDRFIDWATWESDGSLATLLTSPVTFINEPLAKFYGIPDIMGTELRRVEDPAHRSGVLTMGAFLASQAKPRETSPILRGMFVREQLFCQIPPPPPDNVNTQLPKPTSELVTLRERMEDHRADVSCAKCHRMFDPLGFAFESYDAIGRWRVQDHGRNIDTTGTISQSDVDGNFAGARELTGRLAQSDQVRDCMVRQWFRFGYGRTESAADACTLADLKAKFADSGYAVRELLVALTQTDVFLYRRGPQAPGRTAR